MGADLGDLRQLVTRLGGPCSTELNAVLQKMAETVQGSSGYWTGANADRFRSEFTKFTVKVRGDLDRTLESAARVTGQNLAAIAAATGAGAGPSLLPGTADLSSEVAAAFSAEHFFIDQQDAASPALARQVSTWWRHLSAAERSELLKDEPATIGALDGLPATVRDQANRGVFSADYAKLEAQKAELESQTKGATSGILGVPVLGSLINDADGTAAKQAQLANVEGLLSGMDTIKARLGQPGKGQGGLPPVYLLGFDTSDLGHVMVSFGDPDTANNVVTYVPGVGAKLSSCGGDLERAARLWRQSGGYAPGKQIASIYWLGYHAPQLDTSILDPTTSLASEDEAKAAAPALDSFAAGLAAAHDPAFKAHSVMLGHSYGSLTVGMAATRWPGKLADDLAFVGSPGVGVSNAGQLGVPADHVFAGQAANDPVPDLPATPSVPLEDLNLATEPIAALSELAIGWGADRLGLSDASHFGTNPARPSFGAQDFAVDPSSIGHAHSSYWDLHSTSLKNLARIVDGEQVTLAYPGGPSSASGSPSPSAAPPPVPPSPTPQPPHPAQHPSPSPQPESPP